MSHRSLPSAFVKTVLHNGVGRYVCQMSRVTIKFCKSDADSRGMRLLTPPRLGPNLQNLTIYRTIIVISTYDSDLKRAKTSFRNIVS